MNLRKLFGKKYPYKIGITFSGGSARGYAHVGILKALSEHGIEPEIISGTSMGAVVGVLYAAGYSPREVQRILINEKFSKIAGFSWKRTGLLKMERLRLVLHNYIEEDNFSQLEKPFYLGLTNLNEGTKEIRTEGALFDYLIASCSVPGVFAPMVIEEVSYVDGGLLRNLPASCIRDKCRILIGAHVNYPGRKNGFTGPKGIVERAINLGITENAKPQMELCDYMIDPPAMECFSLFDFSKIEEIIEAGYSHTMELINSGELPVREILR